MASVMGMSGARWGLKSKMMAFHLFYHYFLNGQGGQGDSKKTNNIARNVDFGVLRSK